MTTNTYLFYDTLFPLVGSVISVHPPNVRLVIGVKVKTDKKAALTLAGLCGKIKVLVGGASVSETFAKQIGADGYASDASRAVELARSLMIGKS